MKKSGWKGYPSQVFPVHLKEAHKEKVAIVALAIHRNLVLATPVDTGRARSNWQPSVGTPVETTTSATTEGAALSRAEGEWKPERLPDWPTLYIANNLDYIGALNDGHSKKAPAHFVEMAIAGVTDAL